MPTGRRDQRFNLYGYAPTDVDGIVGTQFVQIVSDAPDGAWWGRKEPANARELAVAAQSQHAVDWVVVFGPNAPVSPDGLVKDVATEEMLRVTGVYPARGLRELIVHAVRADDEVNNAVQDLLDIAYLLPSTAGAVLDVP